MSKHLLLILTFTIATGFGCADKEELSPADLIGEWAIVHVESNITEYTASGSVQRQLAGESSDAGGLLWFDNDTSWGSDFRYEMTLNQTYPIQESIDTVQSGFGGSHSYLFDPDGRRLEVYTSYYDDSDKIMKDTSHSFKVVKLTPDELILDGGLNANQRGTKRFTFTDFQ